MNPAFSWCFPGYAAEILSKCRKATTIQEGSEQDMAKRRRSPVENETVDAAQCSPGLRLSIVRGLPFLSSLDEEAIVAVGSLFQEKGFAAGEIICFSQSPATHFYVVASGLVKLLHHTEEGRDVILDLLGRGGFFGQLFHSGQDRYTYSVQALTATCALAISGRSFQGVLNTYPTVALDMLKVVSVMLESAQATIRRLSVDSAEKRLAAVLARLGEKFGEKKEVGLLIQLPLSREDLADMSGTTTETASRVISELRREDIIRTGRRWVSIRDFRRLSSLAGHPT